MISSTPNLHSTSFRIAAVLCFAAFLLFNAIFYQANWGLRIFDYFDPSVLWDIDARGFPFIYYYSWSGVPDSGTRFALVEMIANFLVAAIGSFGVGIAVNAIDSKLRR